MASLSILDDDRRPTPDFFYKRTPDPAEILALSDELKVFAEPKPLIDHDLNNYRQRLWSFDSEGSLENEFALKDESEGTAKDIVSGSNVMNNKNDASSTGSGRPALKRWYFRHTADDTPQKMPLPRDQRLKHTSLVEKAHNEHQDWNVSPARQEVNVGQNNIEEESSLSFSHPSLVDALDFGLEIPEHLVTLSPTPITGLVQDSSISSHSEEENISEDNRKIVARQQYYNRRGVLWDCAAMLLETFSLHPSSLTEFEFTKLVCLQGYEIFQWLVTNCRYFVERAESQWHQANGLLRNNAGLDGLNTNFMDDFLWMEANDQVSFIRSYKRLQLEAMALREGVRLTKTELDALCMLKDENKLAIVQLYKDDAVQASLRRLRSLNEKASQESSNDQETEPQKADNLHLKFLYGFGHEKCENFQDLVWMDSKGVPKRKTQDGETATREPTENLPETIKETDALEPAFVRNATSCEVETRVQSKVVWDLNASQRHSEASNSSSEASRGSSDKSPIAPSIFDGPMLMDPCLEDSVSEHIILESVHGVKLEPVPTVASFLSEVETLVGGRDDLPQLKRHKISYNDLRGLATTVQLANNIRHSSENCDEGSDWDFSPPKSLRRKASRLLDAFKKPFTFSSGKRNRRPVKDYFDRE
ncbi:uncharacterized protein LY89DRAFT_724945 [Mollisia scopiformis]|uniref:Uncharacterized protein n=1 Tax=Mollisia scopiformis TaxID=149040 RepID=A0A132B8Z6_MOLSC|nr:uncharacterized protein LY89DRAFT_724945 [Mollisia scopiformis]KUJ08469.1 hypothetical protein LY89DRAFT_724945 [Mollisia scopiformis]